MAGPTATLEDAIMIVILEVAVDTGIVSVQETLCRVAVIALNVCVLTQQRKADQVMIEERRVEPLRFVMAVRTLLSELTFMRIILKVTADAIRVGRRIKNRVDMAVLTSDGLMRILQREIGRQVMIKCWLCPVLARVTGPTVSAAVSIVVVVLQVATGTRGIHDVIKRVFVMTVGAEQVDMLAL